MKVKEIMTMTPEVCRPEDNLARAVEQLWAADCGVLPIVDDTGRRRRHPDRPRHLHRAGERATRAPRMCSSLR